MEQPLNTLSELFIPALRDKGLFQVNAINTVALENKAKELGISGVPLEKVKALMSSKTFSDQEIKD